MRALICNHLQILTVRIRQVGLDYAEAMTDTARRVTPVQIAALKRHFDDDGVVALTAWIAFQNLSAKFNSALGAEDNGLCKLPGKSTGPS